MASGSGQNLVVFSLNDDDKSAISRFSVEVLALFFTEAVLSKSNKELREDAGDTPSGLVRRLPTEVCISHVCQRWRAISLDLSVLWKTFYFSYNPDAPPRTIIARFQSYMERSGTQLLDLWFDLASVPSDPFRLVEHAIKYATRWRRFSIFLHSKASLENLSMCFLMTHAPHLEYLAIHPHDHENVTREEIYSDILSIPFILPRSLKLSSFWFDISAVPYFLPPLSNITTLRIDSSGFPLTIKIDFSGFLSILAIPALEHLSLAGNIIKYHYSASTIPVTVPHLKHLQFIGAYTHAELFKFIDAPLLDVLVLERLIFHAKNTEHEFVDPFPALRSLVLLKIAITNYASGLALATFTKNITNLVISANSKDSGVLEFIEDRLAGGKDALARGEINLWPQLQDVTFSLADYKKMTFYKDFLAARPINTPPLILHIHKYLLDTWRYLPSYLGFILERAELVPMENDRPIIIIKEGWHLGRGRFGDHLDTYDTLEIESPHDFAEYSFEYESEKESQEESEATFQEDPESDEENT